MFAPVFAILLAFLASASAVLNQCNAGKQCNGAVKGNLAWKNNAQECSDGCATALGASPNKYFTWTTNKNCLCFDVCNAPYLQNGADSYCIPPTSYSKCADGKQCGGNGDIVNVVGTTVEACATACGAYSYFTFVTGTGNCYCSNTCSTYNTVATESAAYRINGGVCPVSTLRG
jgi:hypothetical protein